MPSLTFIALRCSDIDACRKFYELAGLTFGDKHRHGSGPEHVACESMPGVVFELYPKRKADSPDRTAVGIAVENLLEIKERFIREGFVVTPLDEQDPKAAFVVRDPDNRRVEISGSDHHAE